ISAADRGRFNFNQSFPWLWPRDWKIIPNSDDIWLWIDDCFQGEKEAPSFFSYLLALLLELRNIFLNRSCWNRVGKLKREEEERNGKKGNKESHDSLLEALLSWFDVLIVVEEIRWIIFLLELLKPLKLFFAVCCFHSFFAFLSQEIHVDSASESLNAREKLARPSDVLFVVLRIGPGADYV